MITLFSTPKPFRGHIDVIQRNAIRSWKRLHPDIEIILVGDDHGTAAVCGEMGLRHEPRVRRSESGAKYLNDIFRVVQDRATHDTICYVNCDIILFADFIAAARKVSAWRPTFLMVGQRTDVDLTESLDVSEDGWDGKVRQLAAQTGAQRDQWWIDYFLFNRSMFRGIPDFLIGRIAWDNWLIWKARSDGHPVVDATAAVLAVHQNHDYAYHPQGREGVFHGEEAAENRRLAGGRDHMFRISDSNYRLTASGIRRNVTTPHLKRRLDNGRRYMRRVLRTIRTDGLRALAQR